jgi:hypothetical protein
MKRFFRLLAGLCCLGIAGIVCWADRPGWPWFLGAGFVLIAVADWRKL